jgi:hypothetical protein
MRREPATFGEFLNLARGNLAGMPSYVASVSPGRDVAEVSQGMFGVVTALAGYTGDATRMVSKLPARQMAALSRWDWAGLQAHDALLSAAAALEPSGWGSADDGARASSQAGLRLHSAATALRAGRDLLQGHFATSPRGARIGHSGWALVITSPAVTRAMLSETASLARQTAAAGDSLLSGVHPKSASTDGLATAVHWLDAAAGSMDAAGRAGPATTAERELLHAIPANASPAPWQFTGVESASALCQAVITTAERARRAAWVAAELDPQSAAISVTSWHRIASASTVTSHNCCVLCATLADRMFGNGDRTRQVRSELMRVSVLADGARETWLDSARESKEIVTEIRGHMSPAAAEAAELARWTGRLAYADPAWDLASGPSGPERPAEFLAPNLADARGVIGAVHHALDALAGLAMANVQQARCAIRAQRVLVATRSLPDEYDIPSPYTQAPASYETSLLMCYEDTAMSARLAAEAIAGIAVTTRASSRTLATARAAAQQLARDRPGERWLGTSPPSRQRGGTQDGDPEEGPGPIESELRGLGVSDPRSLWRAAAIDRAGRQLIAETGGRSRHRSRGPSPGQVTEPAALRRGTHRGARVPSGQPPPPDSGSERRHRGIQAEP